MNKSIVTKNKNEVNAISGYSPDQLALITSTVAKGATQDELKLFLYRANNLGLDPLKPGQIHFVKYGQGNGSIVVGIDGFRAKAQRTGKLSGIKRGSLRDEKGNLVGGWAEVYRTDWEHPAREEVPLSEYNTNNSTWRKMPETMIKKVAECAALRMAFPDDLGGVYAPEEMDQAQQFNAPVRESSPKKVNDSESAIREFMHVYEEMCDNLGADCYKKYIQNSEGKSPTVEQILNWKSEKQIAWLRDCTAQMIADWAEIKSSGSHKVPNDLPDFDDAKFEDFGGENA